MMSIKHMKIEARKQLLRQGLKQVGLNKFIGKNYTALITNRPGMTKGAMFNLGLLGKIPPREPKEFNCVIVLFSKREDIVSP